MTANLGKNESINILDRIQRIRSLENAEETTNVNLHFPDRGDNWREFSQWWDPGKLK